ncbi:hypothetical protein G6F22_014725 [Rhizopus arrhizus]|nr:hypothetical protein G6F22_014725 [Rhizopus arrhizus]
MLAAADDLRGTLAENTAYFREKMTAAGFDVKPGVHPISPVMLYDAPLAQKFAERLLEEGIYAIGFFFPVVPKGQARIRTQISAAHSREHLDRAIDAFTRIGVELGGQVVLAATEDAAVVEVQAAVACHQFHRAVVVRGLDVGHGAGVVRARFAGQHPAGHRVLATAGVVGQALAGDGGLQGFGLQRERAADPDAFQAGAADLVGGDQRAGIDPRGFSCE